MIDMSIWGENSNHVIWVITGKIDGGCSDLVIRKTTEGLSLFNESARSPILQKRNYKANTSFIELFFDFFELSLGLALE